MTAILHPCQAGDGVSQHMEALARANTVRRERAAIKRDVRAGLIPLAIVIETPQECWRPGQNSGSRPVTVAMMLTWQPRWGDRRAEKLLRRHGISETVTVFDLSDQRRLQLTEALR